MSPAYWGAVGIGAVGCAVLTITARRRPGHWALVASRLLALALAADAVVFVVHPVVVHDWSVQDSLPLALCDVALVITAGACWAPDRTLLVELTYFWGLAGTLQAVATPDLSARFPHLEFFEYVVGHVGIVTAAIYLVVGLRRRPRPWAIGRIWLITAAYTAAIGAFDAATGSDYMFLAARPHTWSLLSVLGPWPWYVVSAAALAVVLLAILDAPFWRQRHLRHGT